MKRLLLSLFALILFTALGPLLPAHASWWHRHSSPNPAGVGADKKSTASKPKREHHQHVKNPPLYSKPKSLGWWHHDTPGPMGAGSNET
jgi:hypothetical protein